MITQIIIVLLVSICIVFMVVGIFTISILVRMHKSLRIFKKLERESIKQATSIEHFNSILIDLLPQLNLYISKLELEESVKINKIHNLLMQLENMAKLSIKLPTEKSVKPTLQTKEQYPE